MRAFAQCFARPPGPSRARVRSDMDTIVTVIGWAGFALILIPFALNSLKLMEPGRTYHVCNLLGGSGVAAVSIQQQAWQPAALNVIWAVVAIVSLVVMLRRGKPITEAGALEQQISR